MRFKDYYRILGVAPEASADDIKAAYRKLARKYHPDVNKDKDAQARFVEIGEAYEALGDAQKRAAYDRLRQAGFQEGQEMDAPPPGARAGRGQAGGFPGAEGFGGAQDFGGGHFTDIDPEEFSEFFQSIFGGRGGPGGGGGGRRGRARRNRMRDETFHELGEDLRHTLPVTLEEAYHGGERRLRVQAPELDGRGRQRRAMRTIDVRIPAGVTGGSAIRLRGQGLPGSAPENDGDLYLDIVLEPHALFTVEGREVRLQLPLAPWEAVLGATVSVPTLGGPVNLRVPPGSSGGDKLRLRGRGLPGEPPGDQIVTLVLAVPATVSERERELYRQLAQISRFDPRSGISGAG